MLTELVVICSAGAAFVSLCLSMVALLIHYAKRGEHPEVAPLINEIQSLRLAQAEIVDRVEHFVKRSNARRVRDQVDELPPVPSGIPEIPAAFPKGDLRNVARQRGIIK